MFDERSLNSLNPTIFDREDYQRTLKILNALVPVIEASVERLQHEWDKWAHIEIGDDTYVMKPNESGGYSWEKIDYEDHDWYEGEDEAEVEIDEENLVNSDVSTTAKSSAASEQSTDVTAQEPQEETVTNATVSEVLSTVQSRSPSSPSTNTETQQQEQTVTNAQSQSSAETSTAKVQTSSSDWNPEHIDLKHWKELVEDSAIDPLIASANFKSLHQNGWQHQAWEHLFYSDDVPRRNDGRLRDGDLKRYSHIEKGGWWCEAGVDPRSFANLSPGQQPDKKLWGCYKPDEPRYQVDQKKQKFSWTWHNKSSTPETPDKPPKLKKIKYEHPPKTELSIFLLEVPDEIANKVYSKAGVNPSASDRADGFWYCVWKHNIPITITEGAKKTAAILSQGDAAIGLPGINAGYRSYDQQKNPITPHLREEFAVFATPGRDIKICFDYETKAKTKRSVFAALAQTGKLLEAAEVKVSVVSLPGPEKGIDDLIVAHGTEAYQKVMSEVLLLQQWQQQNPPPDLRFIITLKDGREINLYEKLSDGTVTSNPAELNFAEIDTLTQKLQENLPLSKASVESQIVVTDLEAFNDKNDHTQVNFPKYWVGQRQVPNYAQNLPRSFLLQKENKQIALTAKKLIDQYGGKEDDGSFVYRSEAFSIRKSGDKISIHRAVDEKESYSSFPLMQFEVDKKERVKIIKPPLKMLSVERQEFLNVANSNELPSFYEDAITLKQNLGSLAPLGTQKVIKNLEVSEISQLLTTILETAGSKHLQVGEYRIKSESLQQTGHSSINTKSGFHKTLIN
ncbi:MAG: DUF3854 domain-containing protein [Komarekiella atlantica HA4396-MV6]|jgi:hypothetical protein|nr:DUF3854 domain-containing protein [Komarekiella atlantica HA4396-MV6]